MASDSMKLESQVATNWPCASWELNQCPLEEHLVLLSTESSLQPYKRSFEYIPRGHF